MYCKYCGNVINYNAKFCNKCGNSIVEETHKDQDGCQFNGDFIEEFYMEPISTSIIKGIDFIPNCIGKLFGSLGSQTYFYCHILGTLFV